jgi:hypothetical protein
MTSNNVIKFPREPQSLVPTPQEARQNLHDMNEEDIEIIVNMVCSSLLDKLTSAGFPVNGELDNVKDICFIMESVRSLISKCYDVDHPFQAFAEECFEVVDDNIVFNSPYFIMKERFPEK